MLCWGSTRITIATRIRNKNAIWILDLHFRWNAIRSVAPIQLIRTKRLLVAFAFSRFWLKNFMLITRWIKQRCQHRRFRRGNFVSRDKVGNSSQWPMPKNGISSGIRSRKRRTRDDSLICWLPLFHVSIRNYYFLRSQDNSFCFSARFSSRKTSLWIEWGHKIIKRNCAGWIPSCGESVQCAMSMSEHW